MEKYKEIYSKDKIYLKAVSCASTILYEALCDKEIFDEIDESVHKCIMSKSVDKILSVIKDAHLYMCNDKQLEYITYYCNLSMRILFKNYYEGLLVKKSLFVKNKSYFVDWISNLLFDFILDFTDEYNIRYGEVKENIF